MKVDDTETNAERCMCPDCPTYNDCMSDAAEKVFCSRGATSCGPRAASCVCGSCEVWGQYSLDAYYYCIQGAAS